MNPGALRLSGMSDAGIGHFHPPCRSRRPRGGLSNRRPLAASGCPQCYAARPADAVPTSLTESKPHPHGPLYRWRIRGNATRSPSPQRVPDCFPRCRGPGAGGSSVRGSGHYGIAQTPSRPPFGLRPPTGAPDSDHDGLRPGTSAPDPFLENRANTECSQLPHGSR